MRIENNKVSDIIRAQTKDFVDVTLKLSYCVNFIDEYKDKWFSVENYVNDYIWCKGETTISIRSTMEPVGDDEWLDVEAPAGTVGFPASFHIMIQNWALVTEFPGLNEPSV